MVRWDDWETRLSVVQKLLIIFGLLVSGWYVLIREDHSNHGEIDVAPRFVGECSLVAEVMIANPKGVVWEVQSMTVQLYHPNYETVLAKSNNSLKFMEQVRTGGGRIKTGESGTVVFAFDLRGREIGDVVIVRAQFDLKENGGVMVRQIEKAVEAKQCA